ncbi:GNAT family N-acetyltransferase [Pseudonocardia sp. ICBG1293]|uniref:GNAT family N-acetyltransferase n=1 Tax=Pseudonocardia sp. ICBG1293 TaxID=2844382 RepID=UPI001CC8F5CF|nr:GNAT family N-acetyltransferase [Pseudonocardia sp. ICBG1293]
MTDTLAGGDLPTHAPPDGCVPTAAARWTIEHLTGLDALDAVAAEWDDLVDRCASATPFQRSAWLRAWWQHYGPAGEPCFVAVRRGGVLVAGAAVFTERRAGVVRLSPVGRGLSDVTEFLADDAHRGPAVTHLADALLAVRDWHVTDLPEIRPGSVAADLAAAWPRRTVRTPASVCPEIPHRTVEDMLAAGPAPKYLRRRLRTAERSGITCGAAPADALPGAVDTLLDLHHRQWARRAVNPEHHAERFRGLLTDAVPALARDGAAQIDLYHRDGRPVAAELLLLGGRSVHTYLVGADPALRTDVDVAALTIRRGIAVVAEHGLASLDLLRGDEPYKRRWRAVPIRQERVLLVARSSAPVVVLVAAARARAALRRRIAGGGGGRCTERSVRRSGGGAAPRRRPPSAPSSTGPGTAHDGRRVPGGRTAERVGRVEVRSSTPPTRCVVGRGRGHPRGRHPSAVDRGGSRHRPAPGATGRTPGVITSGEPTAVSLMGRTAQANPGAERPHGRRGPNRRPSMSVLPDTPAVVPDTGAAAIPAPRTAAEDALPPPAPATPAAVDLCRCGHERDAHEHYRAGTDCGACGTSCRAFHARTGTAAGRAAGRVARLTSGLRRRR